MVIFFLSKRVGYDGNGNKILERAIAADGQIEEISCQIWSDEQAPIPKWHLL